MSKRITILLGILLLLSGLAFSQTQPTNLGPIKITYQDYVLQSGALPLPPSGVCRAYFVSGTTTWINSTGGPCGPTAGSCPNCVTTDGSGNATIAGDFTALELILSGSGPLDVVTPCNTVSAPLGGYGLLGMGAGCVPVVYPSALSTVVPLAFQDGSGNVYQNANTASAAKTAGSQCSGHYAVGVDVNWNAICDGSTYVLIPTITDPGATASSLALFGTTSDIQAHINGGSLVTVLRKDTAFATWGPCNIGGTTAVTQYCSWTIPAGITVISMDLWANQPPLTCSTYPVIALQDSTAGSPVSGFSITTVSATTAYNVTGSTAVTSGHVLTFKVTTAASGCGTNAANVTATITYRIT